MKKAIFYLEKNENLHCTFACLAIGNIIHRFRISDRVVRFLSLRKESSYDYLLQLQYDNGEVDEEYWEFKYMFRKMGIPADSLYSLEEVALA